MSGQADWDLEGGFEGPVGGFNLFAVLMETVLTFFPLAALNFCMEFYFFFLDCA